jgi:hypothetical protein
MDAAMELDGHLSSFDDDVGGHIDDVAEDLPYARLRSASPSILGTVA